MEGWVFGFLRHLDILIFTSGILHCAKLGVIALPFRKKKNSKILIVMCLAVTKGQSLVYIYISFFPFSFSNGVTYLGSFFLVINKQLEACHDISHVAL